MYVTKAEFDRYIESLSAQLKLFRDEYIKTTKEVEELKKEIKRLTKKINK